MSGETMSRGNVLAGKCSYGKHLGHKNVVPNVCSYFRQIVTDFENYFSATLYEKI